MHLSIARRNWWPPGMVRHCQYVSNFSVCNDTHLSHKFDEQLLYTSDTLPTNLLTQYFLKRMHNVRKEWRTLSRLVSPCTQAAKCRTKSYWRQPRWSSLETPGISRCAFPNSLNFVRSNKEERARLVATLCEKCLCNVFFRCVMSKQLTLGHETWLVSWNLCGAGLPTVLRVQESIIHEGWLIPNFIPY